MSGYIDLLELLNEVCSRQSEEDIRIWDGDPSGVFSVKAGIRTLQRKSISPIFLDISWKSKCPSGTIFLLVYDKR